MNTYFVGCGSPLIDALTKIDEISNKGSMTLIDQTTKEQLNNKHNYSYCLGGSSLNTIYALLKLKAKGSFIGKIKDDKAGNMIVDKFKEYGGDVTSFKTSTQQDTGICFSFITDDSERTLKTYLGAASTLAIADISIDDFPSKSHVHIESYLLVQENLVEHIIALAKKKECSISIDLSSFDIVNNYFTQLQQILSQVDIIFANFQEAQALTKANSLDVLLEKCAKYDAVVCVKKDKEGAYVIKDDKMFFKKSYQVKALDTTGAGDIWQAGFLYGYFNQKSIENTIDLANYMASFIVQIIGGHLDEQAWEQIMKKVESL